MDYGLHMNFTWPIQTKIKCAVMMAAIMVVGVGFKWWDEDFIDCGCVVIEPRLLITKIGYDHDKKMDFQVH